jgi:hypothetical protein
MRLIITLACLFTLITARTVSAVPIYLIFKGEVTRSTAQGYEAGQAVHYVFRIDTDAEGHYSANHFTSVYADYADGEDFADFFLADYVSGDAIAKDLLPSGPYEYHFGYNENIAGDILGVLFGSNGDPSGNDYIEIHASSFVSDWVAGMGGFEGYNFALSDNSQQYVMSDLTLVGISESNPLIGSAVPEPSGMVLAGMGLVGVALVVRRKNKRG